MRFLNEKQRNKHPQVRLTPKAVWNNYFFLNYQTAENLNELSVIKIP